MRSQSRAPLSTASAITPVSAKRTWPGSCVMCQARQLHELADALFGKPLAPDLSLPDYPGQVVSRAGGVRRVALDLPLGPIRLDPNVAADSPQLDIHLRALTVGKVVRLEYRAPGRHVTPLHTTPTAGRPWRLTIGSGQLPGPNSGPDAAARGLNTKSFAFVALPAHGATAADALLYLLCS